MPHPIILGLGAVLGIYGLVFLQQIFAIRSAKGRVRRLIAGDTVLEQLVRDEPARFLAQCTRLDARDAYEALARRYAGLQRHMLGFFGLSALLFLVLNIVGLINEHYEGLALVDVMFVLAAVLVLRTTGKIQEFRSAVLSDAEPEIASAVA